MTNSSRARPSEIQSVAKQVVGCAYTVQNTLGAGFLEKAYENALAHELRKAGLKVEAPRAIEVVYDNIVVGDYVCDLLVNDCVLV